MKMKLMNKEKDDFGFILIDKISGPSSHDIIYQLRRISSIRKIGHAGTLDPIASGLMIVAIGREATKRISNFVKLDKLYTADIVLGKETDTYDREGQILKEYQGRKIKKKEIKEEIIKLEQSLEQIPPMYSAKKIKGKKLYELARKNIEVEREPQKIKIYKIAMKKYSWPHLRLEIHCSSGTYVRSIVNDLGKSLHCGAYLKELKRKKIGDYHIKNAKKIKKINKRNWKKHLFHLDKNEKK